MSVSLNAKISSGEITSLAGVIVHNSTSFSVAVSLEPTSSPSEQILYAIGRPGVATAVVLPNYVYTIAEDVRDLTRSVLYWISVPCAESTDA